MFPDTVIRHGTNFNDNATLLERPYNFEEIRPGIYMDTVEDHNPWYEMNPVKGGIYVGDEHNFMVLR
jgi:hypothetical protein